MNSILAPRLLAATLALGTLTSTTTRVHAAEQASSIFRVRHQTNLAPAWSTKAPLLKDIQHAYLYHKWLRQTPGARNCNKLCDRAEPAKPFAILGATTAATGLAAGIIDTMSNGKRLFGSLWNHAHLEGLVLGSLPADELVTLHELRPGLDLQRRYGLSLSESAEKP